MDILERALNFFYPGDAEGREWGGYARFYDTTVSTKDGNRLTKFIREGLYDQDYLSLGLAIDLLGSQPWSWSDEDRCHVRCVPTGEGVKAASFLRLLLEEIESHRYPAYTTATNLLNRFGPAGVSQEDVLRKLFG